jgi:hypothetical protein
MRVAHVCYTADLNPPSGSGAMLCRTDYPRTVSIALAVVEAKEVFAVQDDVTQEIVSALVSKMRRAETARAKRKREAKSGQHVDVCRALR